MKQKKGFVLREICGERVIVAEGLEVINFNKMLSLSETAAFCWKKAGELGDFTAADLADALCADYEVERAVALADVEAMLKQWAEIGIVE